MKAKAIPLTKAAVEAAAEELRRERAFVAKFDPRPAKDQAAELQNRVDVLNRCIDSIRELCEDNLCNVPYLRVVMDEIAMIGPMYERAPPAVPYLCDATRFKLSFDSKGRVSALCHFAKELDGRWVALVPAEDDSHMRYAEARK